MLVAVTRPGEDAGPLTARLEAMGHEVVMAPLLTIQPRAGVTIPALPWQAVAVTSANGIRALPEGHGLSSFRVLTVGPQSLRAAAAAGLKAEAHGGDVNGLAAFIRETLEPKAGPILYLSGAETAGDLQAQLAASGFDCRRVVLYDAAPAETLGAVDAALRQGLLDAVLLYSPRSAKVWRGLVERAGLFAQAARVRHLCLSRNVAAALADDWNSAVSASPDEAAILELLEQSGRTL
ncbi:MAG: uroporphyrinogen-III synthase [Aestuariivirga sp.]|uniref:uroporphyrinogen-III synthase n=1 Tax=Aestuariivirga sp. TaxID=2650926 RepID=UPI0025BADFA4|nr:uroporphyrinogen-III synthase [Aestuariivirga sp.]MCA3561142.1 uroporphyrinogen-III synthase [Aestuariivirga sp.]